MLKRYLLITIFATLAICNALPSTPSSQNQNVEDDDPLPVYTSNTLPPLEEGCKFVFYCQKKYKESKLNPKPCLKLCVNHLMCNDEKRPIGRGHCLTFDEETVAKESDDFVAKGKVAARPVAMIDFPCQPGYLPDNRGRCREVW